MGDAVPWVGFVIGLATVLATGGSIVTTVIMPRFSRSRIALTAWRLVERPALALKSRWAPRPGAAAPPRSRGAVPAG